MLAASVAMMCMTSCAKEDNPIDAELEGVPGATTPLTTVTGKVLDEMGEPIIGASVNMLGSNTSAITNFNGQFSIEVPSNATLIISYIGYISQNYNVQESNDIIITLKEDSHIENDIVVVN